ncbi:MAG: hypothetical protein GDA39_02920 [Hyphomonadaceae bacterium]|nr:hypothetical protein [Hyphomonadaceae bacterium]MBC6411912.1 hypothetical protein [Hyphomonadaceae bacterium]
MAEEHEAQICVFLDVHKNFSLLSAGEVWEEKFGVNASKPRSPDGCPVALTRAPTNTDGFSLSRWKNKKENHESTS